MLYKRLSLACCLVIATTALFSTGCLNPAHGPDLGLFAIPIPVSPYFQKRLEDEAYEHERYNRVPVMGPITAGIEIKALDPPSDDEIIRALGKARPLEGGLPFFYEKQRNNVRIVKEKIADYVDPPRFIPLIGPAQLHHAHYKITIYFEERTWIGWPIPHELREEDSQEVLYIDHNHFHMVGNVTGGVSSHYQ